MIKSINDEGRVIGEGHPRAVHSDARIMFVQLLHDAGMGYSRISKIMHVPRGTVISVCTGRSRCQVAVRHARPLCWGGDVRGALPPGTV